MLALARRPGRRGVGGRRQRLRAPAARHARALHRAGARVLRTDRDGATWWSPSAGRAAGHPTADAARRPAVRPVAGAATSGPSDAAPAPRRARPVTLVTGRRVPQRAHRRRRAQAVRRARRRGRARRDPAAGLTLAGWASCRAVAVLGTPVRRRPRPGEPPRRVRRRLLGYAAAPAEEVALVLVHGGGPKGIRRARRSCASGRSSPRQSPRSAGRGLLGVRHREVRRTARPSDKDAASFLVDASAATCARWRPPPTSSPPTPTGTITVGGGGRATSAAAPR